MVKREDNKIPSTGNIFQYINIGTLPIGWKAIPLKDILDYEQPQKYLVESENYTKTGTPVLTAGKSFVLGFTTEKQGICKLVPVIIFDDFTTASRYVDFSFKVKFSAVKLLRPRNKDFDIRYIYAQMQHIGYVPGMHQRHWIGIYSYFNIPIPSLDEQRRIVGLLSSLDEAIVQTEALIEKYRNVKQGMMHDLLTYGIDARGNIRSPRTHRFKPSPLGMIPEEWECVEFSTIMEAIDPQPDHRTPAEDLYGVPYLGISDVLKTGQIDFTKCRRVGRHVLEKQRCIFSIANGDIIFGKIGTIGKPKQLSTKEGEYALSANVILIKP